MSHCPECNLWLLENETCPHIRARGTVPTANEAIEYARTILAEAGIAATICGTVRDDGCRDVLFIRQDRQIIHGNALIPERMMVWRSPEGMHAI